MTNRRPLAPETLAAQAGHYVDPVTGAVTPPIHSATTFARDEAYALPDSYIYSRNGTPTYDQLETLLAELDGGSASRVFASGLAAVTAVFETVPTGGHVVAPKVMYHGTLQWLRRIEAKGRIRLSLFDPTDPAALAAAILPGETDLVWIEPTLNPTWDVIDITAAADAAHAAGAVLAVDSTCSPATTTRPIAVGADIVFQSGTKYINGHSDVLAGVLTTRAADDRWSEIETVRTLAGATLGPFEAWLMLRGLRTLFVRFDRACENAMAIARHFEGHPKIQQVLYPGLKSHPGHDIAARQMTGGFGGMLSLLVKGGAEEALTVAGALEVFVRATSLGGVESLIEHRYSIEPPGTLTPPNLLRLSIGIERPDDLIADLDQALERL